jgi:tetratricopeptide (TPR) repeat protein
VSSRIALAVLLCSGLYAEVRADVPARARALAARGRALHAAGDYGHAIEAFREAYALAPSPGLLFNLAQSYRLAGRCGESAAMYREFLASGPARAQRAVATAQLAIVEACEAPMRVAEPAPLRVPVPHPRDVAPRSGTGAHPDDATGEDRAGDGARLVRAGRYTIVAGGVTRGRGCGRSRVPR